jgi:hypothetical protein
MAIGQLEQMAISDEPCVYAGINKIDFLQAFKLLIPGRLQPTNDSLDTFWDAVRYRNKPLLRWLLGNRLFSSRQYFRW